LILNLPMGARCVMMKGVLCPKLHSTPFEFLDVPVVVQVQQFPLWENAKL
jgi:hypothetical protein